MRPSEVAGKNVRKARVKLGVKGSELARRCGWSTDKQSKLERGERSIYVDDLLTLAVALGVAPVWLLADMDGETDLTVEVPGAGAQITMDGVELAAWLVGDHMQPFLVFSAAQFYEFAPEYGIERTKSILRDLRSSGVLSVDESGREVMDVGGIKVTGGEV